ncbi:Hemolymph lipopolysaccharide-binding protein [Blattella germanica]|nr:Hemolymph lipopolysaccharide-binding protein [Blattella germanica]
MLGVRLGFCVIVFFSGAFCHQECNVIRTKPMKFSITSRRNFTGHWIAEVKLDHGADEKDAGPWDVDIEHETEICGKEEAIHVRATLMGYSLAPGFGYYRLHTDLKTWDEALKACEEEGAHLAVLNSEKEAKALSPFWDAHPKIQGGGGNNWAHIGFHDKFHDGQYVTIFNESLSAVGYMKWLPGDPHRYPGEDCGVAVRRDNLIGDLTCNAKMPYFCEWGYH